MSADMEIKGDVKSHGEIEVNGSVEGDITCQALTIGKEAKIKGKIVADNVQVQGTLEGHIQAETVALLNSAHVTGEILHRSLSIEAGAFIEGSARRIDSEEKAGSKITPLTATTAHGPSGDDNAQAGLDKATSVSRY